ncbi:MAG: hypothetical protein LPL00_03995, partial [Alphaproteobacteria bacterium]|nr:hypothetical protein [Alphaproteobacteria bacterium]MDX5368653.1 hypothetical protein [Alphaproteobacteria bacterium]MDX5463398.1 hypothetical protein [Alphaproteobacteria bacterium]
MARSRITAAALKRIERRRAGLDGPALTVKDACAAEGVAVASYFRALHATRAGEMAAIEQDWDDLALSYVPHLPRPADTTDEDWERTLDDVRWQVARAFDIAFAKPAPTTPPKKLAHLAEAFIAEVEEAEGSVTGKQDIAFAFATLPPQVQAHLERAGMIGRNDDDFSMDEALAEPQGLATMLREGLAAIEATESIPARGRGGKLADTRVYTVAVRLQRIFEQATAAPATLWRNPDGTWAGAFLQFLQNAVDHFLPAGLVNPGT